MTTLIKGMVLNHIPLSAVAEQLQVLSNVGGGDETKLTTLVNDLRATIARAGPPPGPQVHLAGDIAINVDQQASRAPRGTRSRACP